jgi:hypothetical protein
LAVKARIVGRRRLLIGKRYLLHDRDPLFTDEFRGVLAASGSADCSTSTTGAA